MDCSGSMAVDAGGTARGRWRACAWIGLAGTSGGSGARRCLGTPVAWCAADGGWECRWSVGLFWQGVGMRLTYCQRSCGCLLVADVGLGDAVGNVLLAAGGEVADWLLSAVGTRPAKEGSWTMAWMSVWT